MIKPEKKLLIKRLFIDTVTEIIETDGLEVVSIRRVAKKTGYNSATIYKYFKNLDHLILLASIKFLRKYVEELDDYTKDAKDKLEEVLLVWEFFCKCSFEIPQIYYSIFFSNLDFSRKDFENYYEIREFYKIYPEEITPSLTKFHRVILKLDIYDRNKVSLINLANEKYISPSNINTLNDMLVLLYKGMLEKRIKAKSEYENKVLYKKTIKYIRKCFDMFLIEDLNKSL